MREKADKKKKDKRDGKKGEHAVVKDVSHLAFIALSHSACNQQLCAPGKTEAHHKQHGVKYSREADGIELNLTKITNEDGIEDSIARPGNVAEYQRKADVKNLFVCCF